MAESENQSLERLANREYQYGFVTQIDEDRVPPGLNEDIVRLISAKKGEPEWLLEWRLKALRRFLELAAEDHEPTWANVTYPKIDYQKIVYFSAPKPKKLQSLDEVDPELLRTYERLGIGLTEQKRLHGIAVDAVFDQEPLRSSAGTRHHAREDTRLDHALGSDSLLGDLSVFRRRLRDGAREREGR